MTSLTHLQIPPGAFIMYVAAPLPDGVTFEQAQASDWARELYGLSAFADPYPFVYRHGTYADGTTIDFMEMVAQAKPYKEGPNLNQGLLTQAALLDFWTEHLQHWIAEYGKNVTLWTHVAYQVKDEVADALTDEEWEDLEEHCANVRLLLMRAHADA